MSEVPLYRIASRYFPEMGGGVSAFVSVHKK